MKCAFWVKLIIYRPTKKSNLKHCIRNIIIIIIIIIII
jgi:hypothetical protein